MAQTSFGPPVGPVLWMLEFFQPKTAPDCLNDNLSGDAKDDSFVMIWAFSSNSVNPGSIKVVNFRSRHHMLFFFGNFLSNVVESYT